MKVTPLGDAGGRGMETLMPDSPHPGPKSPQEAAFAAAFPEIADLSTAQIRELQAYAKARVHERARTIRRRDALIEWYRENQLPLPMELSE